MTPVRKGPKSPERSFGVSVGGVLIVIGAALVWRGRVTRAEIVGGVGGLLLILGLARPMLLTWPSKVWWRFAHALGYVNARIILTILFGLVLLPIGLVWRLVGRDPLGRRRAAWPGWHNYPARYRDHKHYERMF
jgi:Saxitoxin biosynthesis operon protein SxtJ